MKQPTQQSIANAAGITQGYLSAIITRRKIPSFKTAKKIASATNTNPILWCDGTEDEIKAALKQASKAQ
jgi:transcriptional regulator with XRE-family HTH domain